VTLLCCVVFVSSFANSAVQVLSGVGVVYIVMSLLGMVGTISDYLPSYLMHSGELLTGQASPEDYFTSVWIAAGASAVLLAAQIPIVAKRRV
jgi:hypothetical protein